MSSFIKVNVSALSSCQGEFSDEQSYFNNNTYTTFSNGYVCSCGDQYISQMASHMLTCYDTLKTGYSNINDWWTSYVSDVETLENVLSGQSDLGEITSPELIAALGKLYNTDNYDNTLEGEYTGEEDPSIFGIDDQSTIDAAYNQGEVEGKDNALVGLAKEYLTKVTDSCVDIYNEDGTINVMNVIKNIGTIRLNMIKITTATQTTGCLGLAEGILDFGESLFDLGVEGVTWAATGLQKLNGILNGTDYEKANEELWEQTRSFVAKDHVTSLFNKFYETEAGSVIKNNTVAFDAVRGITKGIGYTAGVVGLSTVTGGTFTPMFVGAAAGFGSASEEAWTNGASVEEGLKYAAGKAAWEATQFSVSAFTKPFAMGWRVAGDVFMGGLEGVVDPALKTTYKKGTYDENGNFVDFTSSDSGWDRFTKLFDESGGLLNVAKQAAIGGGTSLLGEYFDSLKSKNKTSPKVVEGEIVPDDNFIENPKPELPPNQTIIDVEGERIGVDYETLDGDVIKDLPTGSKDLIEEFDAKGIGDGSVKGLPPGAGDIDVTTNSKNLTGDVSTEKLDIFEEPEIPKTKVKTDTIDLDDTVPDSKSLTNVDSNKSNINPNNGLTPNSKNLTGDVSTEKLDIFEETEIPKTNKQELSSRTDISDMANAARTYVSNSNKSLAGKIDINQNNFDKYLKKYNELISFKNSKEYRETFGGVAATIGNSDLMELESNIKRLEYAIIDYADYSNYGKSFNATYLGTRTIQVGDPGYLKSMEMKVFKGSDGTIFYEQADIDHSVMSAKLISEEIEKIKRRVGTNYTSATKEFRITTIKNPTDLYWSKITNREFDSMCTAGGGLVNVWSPAAIQLYLGDLDEFLVHEMGHNFDGVNYGLSNSDWWSNAVRNDGNFATEYAKESYITRSENKLSEDLAESLRNLYKMGEDNFRKQFPNRFEIIKNIFK